MEHTFRKLIQIVESGGEPSGPSVDERQYRIMNSLKDEPRTPDELGVDVRQLASLANLGFLSFSGPWRSRKLTFWSLTPQGQAVLASAQSHYGDVITEDDMMSRKKVRKSVPNKDGGDSPLSKRRKRMRISPDSASFKALFSKK